jgi:hypothetical protein
MLECQVKGGVGDVVDYNELLIAVSSGVHR